MRVPGARLRGIVRQRMLQDVPDWDGKVTCRIDLQKYRILAVREAIEAQRGAIGALEASVLERMENNQLLMLSESQGPQTLGERLADSVASFGGSWRFLGMFAGIMLMWIFANAVLLMHPFDPYPFILLNLALSCLAAIQAPVIMMSQNRQEQKDRDRAEHDYAVNLKAELEIHLLHEKLDHLLLDEWQRLLEIQALQTEMLEELTTKSIKMR